MGDYDKVKAFTSVEKPSKSDPPSNPPAIDEKAQTARWLAHSADFGILSTTSVHLNGAPFGNPQSFCDGTTDNSTGKTVLLCKQSRCVHARCGSERSCVV